MALVTISVEKVHVRTSYLESGIWIISGNMNETVEKTTTSNLYNG